MQMLVGEYDQWMGHLLKQQQQQQQQQQRQHGHGPPAAAPFSFLPATSQAFSSPSFPCSSKPPAPKSHRSKDTSHTKQSYQRPSSSHQAQYQPSGSGPAAASRHTKQSHQQPSSSHQVLFQPPGSGPAAATSLTKQSHQQPSSGHQALRSKAPQGATPMRLRPRTLTDPDHCTEPSFSDLIPDPHPLSFVDLDFTLSSLPPADLYPLPLDLQPSSPDLLPGSADDDPLGLGGIGAGDIRLHDSQRSVSQGQSERRGRRGCRSHKRKPSLSSQSRGSVGGSGSSSSNESSSSAVERQPGAEREVGTGLPFACTFSDPPHSDFHHHVGKGREEPYKGGDGQALASSPWDEGCSNDVSESCGCQGGPEAHLGSSCSSSSKSSSHAWGAEGEFFAGSTCSSKGGGSDRDDGDGDGDDDGLLEELGPAGSKSSGSELR
eukprot:1157123-Pelagomonas_calceolata.AAC.3